MTRRRHPDSRPSPPAASLRVFAVVAPGLEGALADEVSAFGVDARSEPGGVEFSTDLETLYRLHLHARVAGRFWVRVGSFPATTLDQLGERLRALPWDRWVWPRQPVDVRVTSHQSRLRHREAVGKKVANAIVDASRVARRTDGRRPPRTPALVGIRLDNDVCTVSVDASGEHLHKRGWRTEAGEAPLRETLAAAVLWLAGWRPGEPLVDPMCGAGTLAIEAASIAEGLPAGGGRSFAFQAWPTHDEAVWRSVSTEAREPAVVGPIFASDRDADVVRTARANARRAGVGDRVAFDVADAGSPPVPPGAGLVVANPPYGARMPDARGAFRALGELLRGPCAGWRWAILSPSPALVTAMKLPYRPIATFPNGDLRITLYGSTQS